MFMSKKIAIIGGGNLGASIAEGLIQSEFSRPVETFYNKEKSFTT
jgi:pyrroline-5-carboxylate reductase